jgi:hypothetical protein
VICGAAYCQFGGRSEPGATVAQVLGGSDFDFVWDDKTNAALRVLREAADVWATRGRMKLDTQRVIGVFMEVLARPQKGLWWSYRWPVRFLGEEAEAPPDAVDSCRALAPSRAVEEYVKVTLALHRSLCEAADMWALGDPEKPSTREQLASMLEILWQERVAPRPPSKHYPEGV